MTLGTFDYISPEQARDPRNADIRSDIYSLGCTLFFMLAGQPPFPEGTVLQKLLQHQGDEPPDVRRLRPDLPEELSRVMRKMMAKDPRHRYASSVELDVDLLALADQIGLRPMSPTSRVWLTPPDRSVSFFQRHLPWMAPVAALLCVVLAVDHFLARRPVAAAADRCCGQGCCGQRRGREGQGRRAIGYCAKKHGADSAAEEADGTEKSLFRPIAPRHRRSFRKIRSPSSRCRRSMRHRPKRRQKPRRERDGNNPNPMPSAEAKHKAIRRSDRSVITPPVATSFRASAQPAPWQKTET